jgi:hypothetical protein
MQLSVDRYQAIRIGRGANLDEIDKPLTGLRDIRRYLELRRKSSILKSDGGLPEEGMVDLLSTINHKWDKDRGNDWSARWFGFIEGPVTGEVTFTAEARDKIRLTVGRTVVIDSFGKNGARVGKVGMVKGKKVPVKLEFSSDNGKALLRLYWQWSGQGKQLVPDSALSHTPDMVPDDAVLFDYENKLSEG